MQFLGRRGGACALDARACVGDDPHLPVASSPDEAALASGSADGAIHLHDRSGVAAPPRRLCSELLSACPVLCVGFSLDGSLLAAGGPTGLVSLWDVASGTCLQAWAAHAGCVLSVAFGADEEGSDGQQLLATGGEDRCVGVWRVGTVAAAAAEAEGGRAAAVRREVAVGRLIDLPGPVLSLRFNRDGTRVYAGTHAGRVEVDWPQE